MSLLDEVYLGFQNYVKHQVIGIMQRGWILQLTILGTPVVVNGQGKVIREWDSLASARMWFKDNGYLR